MRCESNVGKEKFKVGNYMDMKKNTGQLNPTKSLAQMVKRHIAFSMNLSFFQKTQLPMKHKMITLVKLKAHLLASDAGVSK